MKRVVLAALVTGLGALGVIAPAGAAAQAADAARPIALGEAVRLAQQNAPVAVQARGQERVSRAAVRSAYLAFVPNVSVNLGGVRQFTGGQQTRINANGERVAVPVEPWSFNNGLSFNVDLFDGGSRLFEIGASKANVEAAEANETAQRFNVRLSVQQQYYAVLAAREGEGAARTQLELARQQLAAATARVAAGAATLSDSLRSVILVGNAQLALLTAQNNLRTANAALTRLVAAPSLVTALPADTGSAANPTLPPLDSAALDGLAARGPAVLQASAGLAAARAARRTARAPYLPSVTAAYSRNGTGLDSRFGFGSDPFQYQGALRLSLSYPLFNQFQREEQVVRASVAETNAEAALRDARLAAQQEIVQGVSALRTAEQRIAIQQASVNAAVEDLRVQQQRYALGASTLLDQLTSQSQLSDARAALIQARYDARIARAQLEAVIGRELQ